MKAKHKIFFQSLLVKSNYTHEWTNLKEKWRKIFTNCLSLFFFKTISVSLLEWTNYFHFEYVPNMTNTKLLFLFTIITQSVSQDIRSLMLSTDINIKYQCNNPGCSPSTIVSVSSLRNCQFTCLNDAQCRTVTFDQNSNQCELFSDIPSQYGTLLPQTSVATMTAINDRQLSARK